jgi:TPR repeat protein
MADHAPRYPSFESEDGPYEERLEERLTTRSHSVAPYQVGQSGHASYSERSVPLFLSDREGVPDPSEYASSPKKVRLGSYYTSRILAGALGGAVLALLAALVSSDSARQFVASAKASSVAALSVASVVMQPMSTAQPKIADTKIADVKIADVKIADAPIKQAAQPVAPDSQVVAGGTVAVAAVTPTRDDIKTAYQSALQGSAPPAAAAPEVAAPADVIHRLDPAEVASLLKRADALIGSGDVAAARLVLRRAAEAADARAAMMLAGTYDPTVLEKLGVHGVVPDLARARSWYEKARRFGAPEASSQLDRLANRQR